MENPPCPEEADKQVKEMADVVTSAYDASLPGRVETKDGVFLFGSMAHLRGCSTPREEHGKRH